VSKADRIEEIESGVRAQILEDTVFAEVGIEITANDQEVVLRGAIPEEASKVLIERLRWGFSGTAKGSQGGPLLVPHRQR